MRYKYDDDIELQRNDHYQIIQKKAKCSKAAFAILMSVCFIGIRLIPPFAIGLLSTIESDSSPQTNKNHYSPSEQSVNMANYNPNAPMRIEVIRQTYFGEENIWVASAGEIWGHVHYTTEKGFTVGSSEISTVDGKTYSAEATFKTKDDGVLFISSTPVYYYDSNSKLCIANDYYRVLRVAVNDDLTTTTVEDVGILHLNSRNQRYELLKIMVNDGSHAASSVAYEIAKGNYFSYTEAVKWGLVDAAPPISIVPTK